MVVELFLATMHKTLYLALFNQGHVLLGVIRGLLLTTATYLDHIRIPVG